MVRRHKAIRNKIVLGIELRWSRSGRSSYECFWSAIYNGAHDSYHHTKNRHDAFRSNLHISPPSDESMINEVGQDGVCRRAEPKSSGDVSAVQKPRGSSWSI